MAKPVKSVDGTMLVVMRNVNVQLNNVHLEDGKIVGLRDSDVEKIADVDANIVQQAKDNCEAWFGKKLSDEFLENVYDSAIVENTLKARLAKNADGQMLTRFFNEKREATVEITGPYDVIVELYGVEFIRRGYNPVWRILQVRERPKPKPEIPEEYMFQDD
jgi:hypothetical protein